MLSNAKRLYAEIERESALVAQEHELPAPALAALVMEVVDREDQHRIKPMNVVQQVTMLIAGFAQRHSTTNKDS